MTILVIGDSYAQSRTLTNKDNPYCWANCLAKILNTTVDNYGLGASSLEYAYQMFQRHYDENKHNIVIFTRTVPTRRFFFVKDETNERFEKECFVYTIHNKQFVDNSNPTDAILNHSKLKASSREKITKGLVHADVLFPDSNDWKRDAVTESIMYRLGNKKKFLTLDIEDLIKVSDIDYKKFNMERGTVSENDLRPCHMNISQNKHLAEYIAQHLDKKIDIYKFLLNKNIEKYFPAAATEKETGLVR